MAFNLIDEPMDFGTFGCKRIIWHEVTRAPEEFAHFPDGFARRKVRNCFARCEVKKAFKHCTRDYLRTCDVAIPNKQPEILSEPAEVVSVPIGKHRLDDLYVFLGRVLNSVRFADDALQLAQAP